MQDKVTIFENIPYEARAIKGAVLSASNAQEAIEDVLCDTSAFFEMPKVPDILRVKSDNVYGVHKLIVTLPQGTPHPEYMLNARVAELEPKLVSVVFEIGEAQEPESIEIPNTQELLKPQPHSQKNNTSIITLTCSKLGVTYAEFAALIGYEAQDIIAALSSNEVNAAMKKAIELYIENIALKKELLEAQKMKKALKEWLA